MAIAFIVTIKFATFNAEIGGQIYLIGFAYRGYRLFNRPSAKAESNYLHPRFSWDAELKPTVR